MPPEPEGVSANAAAERTPPSRSDPSGAERRSTASALRLLGTVLCVFALYRGSLLSFDLLGLSLTPTMGNCRKNWEVFGKGHELLNGLFRWDAGWYMQIAKNGYSYHPDRASSVAFYPLYPYLARYVGAPFGSVAIGGLVVTNAAAVGAVFYVWRLGAQLFDDGVGKLSALLLLIFPTSLFLSAFYTEALFVCLAAASMHYYLCRRLWVCGALGFAAMLTRSSGIVLFAALALDQLVRIGRREQRPTVHMLALLLIPAGLGAFMLLLQLEVGQPLAFAGSLKHWGREPAWPWRTLIDAFSRTDYSFGPNFGRTQRFIDASAAVLFLAAGVTMASRRLPVALWAYVILGVLMPLSTYNLAGMSRYVLGLFPALILVAELCRERRELERWVIFVSSFFLAIYSLRFMQCGWAG